MLPTILAFDIETIPDIAGIRLLYQLPADLSDADVAEFAFQRRRQQTGSDFLPLHLQRVLVISCALRFGADKFKVWSLGSAELHDEAALIRAFHDGIAKYTPQLVSWNGAGFDLPVLNYRGLIHGIQADRFWDMGENDREFKYNNYISRYHTRHTDLMDMLAMYQGRGNAPLDEMAKLCGFPGKMGMDGSQVWPAFQRGEIAEIRNYCETDACNTYLMALRFNLIRGQLTPVAYAAEIALVYQALKNNNAPHWQEFLAQWSI